MLFYGLFILEKLIGNGIDVVQIDLAEIIINQFSQS